MWEEQLTLDGAHLLRPPAVPMPALPLFRRGDDGLPDLFEEPAASGATRREDGWLQKFIAAVLAVEGKRHHLWLRHTSEDAATLDEPRRGKKIGAYRQMPLRASTYVR